MIASLLTSARFERVLRLLDQERKVILNGPLTELKALVERREALLGELFAEERALPEAFLAAVKARAERNSRLILASIAGVKSAEAQIARIDARAGQPAHLFRRGRAGRGRARPGHPRQARLRRSNRRPPQLPRRARWNRRPCGARSAPGTARGSTP